VVQGHPSLETGVTRPPWVALPLVAGAPGERSGRRSHVAAGPERGSDVALSWTRAIEWDGDDWRSRAACRDTEPDLFFPIGSTGPAVDQIEAAKAVCRACASMAACLEFALVTNQESGVWGGMSEEERRAVRKARRAGERQAC